MHGQYHEKNKGYRSDTINTLVTNCRHTPSLSNVCRYICVLVHTVLPYTACNMMIDNGMISYWSLITSSVNVCILHHSFIVKNANIVTFISDH